MEYIFDRPWELGLLLAMFWLSSSNLDVAWRPISRLKRVPQRKEQMGTIRDGLLVLAACSWASP